MATLTELPPELILHIVSFLTREIVLDPEYRLPGYYTRELKLVPDLPSINALSQTNIAFHRTLDQTLYSLCSSDECLGNLALLFAIEHELESTVDKLVTAGLSLNTEFRFRHSPCSPVHIAACMGFRDMVVKLLRVYGEDMAVKVDTRDRYGLTALDRAVRCENMEIIRLLAPIHNHATPPVTEFETREYLGRALIQSADTGNLELSKYLLSEGADVNVHSEHYGTALYCATSTKNPDLELVQFLLASGADPNTHRQPSCVPLLNARNTDVAKALLLAGASLHAKDGNGRNAVTVQIVGANLEMLRFFLERGVDPNHEDRSQRTALHYVCGANRKFQLEGAEAYLEVLLQFGAATVEKNDMRGRTPVDYAMNSNMTEAVKMFEPLVQDPDLKRKIATWWERNLDEEVEVGEAN